MGSVFCLIGKQDGNVVTTIRWSQWVFREDKEFKEEVKASLNEQGGGLSRQEGGSSRHWAVCTATLLLLMFSGWQNAEAHGGQGLAKSMS